MDPNSREDSGFCWSRSLIDSLNRVLRCRVCVRAVTSSCPVLLSGFPASFSLSWCIAWKVPLSNKAFTCLCAITLHKSYCWFNCLQLPGIAVLTCIRRTERAHYLPCICQDICRYSRTRRGGRSSITAHCCLTLWRFIRLHLLTCVRCSQLFCGQKWSCAL